MTGHAARTARLTEVFRYELEATSSLEAALTAVANEVLAHDETQQSAQLPLPLPPVLMRSRARVEKVHLVRSVLRLVAADGEITVSDLTDRCKRTPLVRARWVAMAILRRHLDFSLPEVATALGLRDHSTIIYGLRMFDRLPDLVARAAAIVEALESAEEEGAP